MKPYQSYRCEKCGNVVEVQAVGGGTLSCCGQDMTPVAEEVTAVNLMKAFAGESQARNKYEFFAEMAAEEGLHKIADFFQQAADNEKYHAFEEFKAYNRMVHGVELDTTASNLQYAAAGENYEHTTMYPNFAAIAKEEGHPEIAKLLTAIGRVEVEHEAEYRELLQVLEQDGFFASEQEEEWVCELCGHVHRGKKPPGACPLCKADRTFFARRCKAA